MSNSIKPTELEKESLAAHVDMCALRYYQLDGRLTKLEGKVEEIHKDVVSGQKSLTTVIITTAGTIIASVLAVVIIILVRGG